MLLADRRGLAQTAPLAGRNSAYSALIVAAGRGDVLPVQRLLAAGADVNARDADGRTALLAANYVDSVAVVRRLIEAGAKVDAADREGITPLFQAQRQNSRDIVRLLEAAGAH